MCICQVELMFLSKDMLCTVQGIGASLCFLKVIFFKSNILFCGFSSQLPGIFHGLKSSKQFLRHKGSNSGSLPRSLWKVETKKVNDNISLKIYHLVHILSNLLQILTVWSLLNFKEIECENFFNFKKKYLFFQKRFFLEFWS